jgi:hypothetical protein
MEVVSTPSYFTKVNAQETKYVSKNCVELRNGKVGGWTMLGVFTVADSTTCNVYGSQRHTIKLGSKVLA